MKKELKFILLFCLMVLGEQLCAQEAIVDLPVYRHHAVKTETILKRGVKTDAEFNSLSELQKQTNISYLDGLYRPMVDVTVQGSSGLKDLVQFHYYDPQGREATQYLPYEANSTDGSVKQRQQHLLDLKSFYTNSSNKVAVDNAPYVVTQFEASPIGSIEEQGAPGVDWQPGAHAVKFNSRSNLANEIRIWKADGTSPGFYIAGTLYIHETTDENGNRTISVSDKLGNTLEKHVQVNETEYLKTLHVYTTTGRLKYVIQPEGVKVLGTGSTLAPAILETWAFQYSYDDRGRLIEKKVPGTAPVYIVYDQLDRAVFVQDGNLRSLKKWYFTKYDRDNRPVYGGIVALTATTMDTRGELQIYMNNLNYEGADPYYEIRNTSSAFHYYSQQTKPNVTAADIHTVYYYDDYNYNNDAANTRDISYVQKGVGTASEVSYTHQRGRLTQLKRKVLESTSGNWLQTYYFYDKEGRALQVRSNNHLNAAQDDFYTLEYTTEGRLNREEEIHRVNGVTTTVKRRYVYQSNGQLGKVYQQNNTDPETLIAYYKYNPVGQLIEKNLAYKGSGDINSSDSYLQSIDLRYNIRGWLNSINNSKLTNNGTTNDDNTDIFGIELTYNMQDAAIGNQQFFNGNVAGVKWKSSDILNNTHPQNERSYAYDYDKADRLTDANFKAIGTTVENGAYNVNDIRYDANGNIQGLTRYSKASSTQAPVKIDELSYIYSGNRLTKVTDYGSTAIGFKGSTTQEQAYLYDANGNMVQDHSNNRVISYNELNKVKAVDASQGNKIIYNYDGTGTRLKEANYSNNALILTTDYIGSFIYENGALASLAMPEGRVVKVDNRMEYQYVIKDHQGNSRMTFRKVIIQEDGTMEPASRQEEALQFDNYDEVTRVSGSLPNKTEGGNTAMRLSGAPGEIIGLAKSMKVKAGDVVKMEVNAKYPKPPKKAPSSAVAAAMGASFANAFGMTAVGEGAQRELFGLFNELFTARPVFDRREKSDVPKAYLNYLLFNKDHVLVDAGFRPVTEAALETGENGEHERLSLEAQVEEEGFMYIYISNENDQIADVWFDDMSVTTTTLEVIQENHFYPFGMPMQGIAVNTPKPTGPNRHIYNGGSELQDELGEARYSTFFREYDASLGRFFAVDPMADSYSNQTPYQYGNNDPIYWNDPSGAFTVGRERRRRMPMVMQDGGAGFGYSRAASRYHWSDKYNIEPTLDQYQDAQILRNAGFEVNFTADGKMGIYWDHIDMSTDGQLMDGVPMTGTLVEGYFEVGKGFGSQSAGVAQNGGDSGFNPSFTSYLALGIGAASTYYGGVGDAFYSKHHWVQGNGKVKFTTQAGNNVLLNRSKDITKAVTKNARTLSKGFGIAGTLVSAGQFLYEPTYANGFDVVMGATAFIPVVGWAISGTYFLSNTITTAVTGQTIGEHIFGDTKVYGD